MKKTFALALGGGGARGLAHIVVLETLDEMGVKPTAIAGTSIGAAIGGAYAAGMSGKQLRRYVINLVHDRPEVMRRMMRSRAGKFTDLFAGGFGDATRLDAEKLCAEFLPKDFPEDFSALDIPLAIVASDLYRREEVVFAEGPLKRAIAASIALPSIIRPVVFEDRLLVDGGATNPLPFDLLRGRADIIVAVDISGPPSDTRQDVPNALECLYATVLVMAHSIINEKLKHGGPDLLLQPKVGSFRALEFFHASSILRVAEPLRDELKMRLGPLIGI